jgi:hypothetical protein
MKRNLGLIMCKAQLAICRVHKRCRVKLEALTFHGERGNQKKKVYKGSYEDNNKEKC